MALEQKIENEAETRWAGDRWIGTKRHYSHKDVEMLRPSVLIEHTLARRGAEKLWG